MVEASVNVLIIGGGVAGLSTAWWLARRGVRGVVVLERNAALGREASAQNAAILRTAMTDPVLQELAFQGADFLRAPPTGFADVPLVDECGLILIAGKDDAAELARWGDSVARHTEVEELNAAELARRAPHYALPVERALRIPREGRIEIAALVEGFARGARERGVELRTNQACTELLAVHGEVLGARLADDRVIRARTTVLAAGGWAGRIGRAAGSRVALRSTRRHLLVTERDARIDPRWPVVWGLGESFYSRPERGGLMLCACDQTDVDPDRCAPDPSVAADIARKAARSLPAFAAARTADFWCGMRTMTRDERFAIGPDPDLAGLFWVAGLGGQGMLSSGPAGRLAAELIERGESDDPLAPALAPTRLAE
jgi:glycine/D-amino acid oxidase-like deaminating enzyme